MRWGVGYVLSSPPVGHRSNPNVDSRCVLGSHLVRGAGHNLGEAQSELESEYGYVRTEYPSHPSNPFAPRDATPQTAPKGPFLVRPVARRAFPPSAHAVPLWSNRILVGSWIIGWSPPPLCLLKKGSCLRARGSLFARKGFYKVKHKEEGSRGSPYCSVLGMVNWSEEVGATMSNNNKKEGLGRDAGLSAVASDGIADFGTKVNPFGGCSAIQFGIPHLKDRIGKVVSNSGSTGTSDNGHTDCVVNHSVLCLVFPCAAFERDKASGVDRTAPKDRKAKKPRFSIPLGERTRPPSKSVRTSAAPQFVSFSKLGTAIHCRARWDGTNGVLEDALDALDTLLFFLPQTSGAIGGHRTPGRAMLMRFPFVFDCRRWFDSSLWLWFDTMQKEPYDPFPSFLLSFSGLFARRTNSSAHSMFHLHEMTPYLHTICSVLPDRTGDDMQRGGIKVKGKDMTREESFRLGSGNAMFKPGGWEPADRAERGCGEAAPLRSTSTPSGRLQEQSQQQVKFETCFMFTVVCFSGLPLPPPAADQPDPAPHPPTHTRTCHAYSEGPTEPHLEPLPTDILLVNRIGCPGPYLSLAPALPGLQSSAATLAYHLPQCDLRGPPPSPPASTSSTVPGKMARIMIRITIRKMASLVVHGIATTRRQMEPSELKPHRAVTTTRWPRPNKLQGGLFPFTESITLMTVTLVQSLR
ncbi:uncharacterized protein CLUP02_06018 [Colletotrichum lupini]|uniref:Uncharacterized protein n=1 Tax=Colletotrichum lupini TaxID=145971 RepID=A0A9Q8SNN2_9PEZI|nr:uncharacterized protein CLUP02_06018 [Colletotrichum lupini]UQC80535.1 hypothetical protein CLUP02_06018 [Colletotrichum lupini]